MKSSPTFSRFILAALLLLAPPLLAADAKTETLKDAQDQLESLKNKYADEHPRVVEQKQRIAQLQRRIDEEKSAPAPRNPIIRVEVRIQVPNNSGGHDLFAAPTLITQPGQEATLSIGAFTIALHSSVDDQGNITTSIELSANGSADKPPEKMKLPVAKSRPGERTSIPVPGGPRVDILATLVEPKGISVDFPGGTLAELLAAIDKSGSQPFNLIASKDTPALALPRFSLRNVSPHNLALALDQILDGYVVDFPKGEHERDGQPVFTIRATAVDKSEHKVEKPKPERFMSYPINRFVLNRIPVDQVIEAINAAWALDPSNKPEDLKLKYHATTGILLVSSREEVALKTAHQVIDSLQAQAQFLDNTLPKPVMPAPPKP